MDPASQDVVLGEVIRTERDQIVVRLEDGLLRTMPFPEDPVQCSRLVVGFRGRFHVAPCDTDVEPILTLLSREPGSEPTDPFDQDVHRLHSVLTNHRVAPNGWETPGDPVGKQQMEAWVSRVGEALARVRKNRSKRLNDTF